MNIKDEINKIKNEITRIKNDNTISSKEKEVEIEKLSVRLKILNHLLCDLILTKIIDKPDIVEQVLAKYIEKQNQLIEELELSKKELEQSLEKQENNQNNILLLPKDIRFKDDDSLSGKVYCKLTEELDENDIKLMLEKVNNYGIEPFKTKALEFLKSSGKTGVYNILNLSDKKIAGSLHLIRLCYHSLLLEKGVIKPDNIELRNDKDKSNKIFISITKTMDAIYMDKTIIDEFIDTILNNKDKFIEYINYEIDSNKRNKAFLRSMFMMPNSLECFLEQLQILKAKNNYIDLSMFLIFYNVNIYFKETMKYILKKEYKSDILSKDSLVYKSTHTEMNKLKLSIRDIGKKIEKIKNKIIAVKNLDDSAKKIELPNLLDLVVLKNLKPVTSYDVANTRELLMSIKYDLKEFLKVKNECKSVEEEYDRLSSHPGTITIRNFFDTKQKLEQDIKSMDIKYTDKYKECDTLKKSIADKYGDIDIKEIKNNINKLEGRIALDEETKNQIITALEECKAIKMDIQSENIFIDKDGKIQKNIQKPLFMLTKTYRDNKSDKTKKLSEVNRRIREYQIELDMKLEQLSKDNQTLNELRSMLTEELLDYEALNDELDKIARELLSLKNQLNSLNDKIENEKQNSIASSYLRNKKRFYTLLDDLNSKYHLLKNQFNELDENILEKLQPGLYLEIKLALSNGEDVLIEDDLLDNLENIEMTMGSVEKYYHDDDIINHVVNGDFNTEQVSVTDADYLVEYKFKL